jgi:hypothetical protein
VEKHREKKAKSKTQRGWEQILSSSLSKRTNPAYTLTVNV